MAAVLRKTIVCILKTWCGLPAPDRSGATCLMIMASGAACSDTAYRSKANEAFMEKHGLIRFIWRSDSKNTLLTGPPSIVGLGITITLSHLNELIGPKKLPYEY
nr:hypothetical protein [Gluconobacter potus]